MTEAKTKKPAAKTKTPATRKAESKPAAQAVIKTGGKQYLVSTGQVLEIEKISGKTAEFEPLLVMAGGKIQVGQPRVKGAKVSAEVLEAAVKGPKIKVLRFKPKKRVKKLTGHRQTYTKIKITSIE